MGGITYGSLFSFFPPVQLFHLFLGIFRPLEKLSDVRTFISEALADQTNTFCFSVLGKSFEKEDVTLATLNMVKKWCRNSDLYVKASIHINNLSLDERFLVTILKNGGWEYRGGDVGGSGCGGGGGERAQGEEVCGRGGGYEVELSGIFCLRVKLEDLLLYYYIQILPPHFFFR